MAIPKFKPLANASEGTKKVVKPVLIAIIALLAGAFGLTATNTDFNIGKLMSGSSLEQAKMTTDSAGNIIFGDPESVSKAIHDASGNFLTTNCKDNLYNCSNFKYQEDAQEAFEKCQGKGQGDINRLDGDKNGVACQDLPSKTGKKSISEKKKSVCTKESYVCKDFKYQEDAQDVLDTCISNQNVKSLDGNSDGKACESLPSKTKN
jgi:hypothetical protein